MKNNSAAVKKIGITVTTMPFRLIPGKLYRVKQDSFYTCRYGSIVMFVEEKSWLSKHNEAWLSYFFLLPDNKAAVYAEAISHKPLSVLSCYLEKVKCKK